MTRAGALRLQIELVSFDRKINYEAVFFSIAPSIVKQCENYDRNCDNSSGYSSSYGCVSFAREVMSAFQQG